MAPHNQPQVECQFVLSKTKMRAFKSYHNFDRVTEKGYLDTQLLAKILLPSEEVSDSCGEHLQVHAPW
jgi:hypothetical protein